MSAMTAQGHHHRSTTKIDHKPFKSKHSTKGELKDRAKGKVEQEDRSRRRTPHQQVMSKLDRRNKAKQLRIHHKEKQDHDTTIFQGVDGAAKHVAVVPLSNNIDVQEAIYKLNHALDIEYGSEGTHPVRVKIDRFKRNLLYMPAEFDLLDAMDVCKLADWVLFLISAEQTLGEAEDMILRAIEGQGITTIAVVITDIESKITANKRSKHIAETRKALSTWFPSLDKMSSLENQSDCANLVRSLCTASTRGIRWRDERSWMFVDRVRWVCNEQQEHVKNPVLEGMVRGRGLNPNRLVHVPTWGEFRIKKIVKKPPSSYRRRANEMITDEDSQEFLPSADQDEMAELAPDVESAGVIGRTDPMVRKGVLLDDHHYFSDDNSHIPEQPKKLPKGTSNYQAAWFLDDVSDSDSDILDEETEDIDAAMTELNLRPEDGDIIKDADTMTDIAGTEYPESEMHIEVDEDEEVRQLQEYRASRKKEAEEDLEFPDEIELHPETLARERLAKYRGLKNLRTSEWNTEEDKAFEPADYSRLLQVPEYKKSFSGTVKDSLVGGVPAGSLVEVELEAVPSHFQTRPAPTAFFSLLRHEHKRAVINLNMTLSSSVSDPVRSKEELIVQIGHRRFEINPIFSASGQTPNDVHKFDRFLHPGRSAIATFSGPLTWGSVPTLVFRRHKPSLDDGTAGPPQLISATSNLELIGTATTVPPSSSRVVAKRIILTGHPFKIHKKLVTIRYMFFNREDVEWFKALPLWTKRGRQGFIKEPLGTHGYFKATFDGSAKVNAMDAVGVSLYKRVWPRPARRIE